MEDVRSTEDGRAMPYSGGIALLLSLTFLLRALYPDQPLVENYVGRQIPTAMVARNLDRGSGFLRPQLETAPFPNYFVVEPPIYETLVVALKRLTSLELPPAGRLVSALLSALAAWGLYELVRNREGDRLALLAVFIFCVFPFTLRYGRAFQPDASMLGTTVAGLACWDRSLRRRSPSWRIAGWCLLATGLAIKITSAFLLVPLLFIILQYGRRREIVMAFTTLLPALLWYGWANHLIGQGTGSHAAADNRSIWLALLGPRALFDPATLKVVGWSLLVRAFTPLGAALALFGLFKRQTPASTALAGTLRVPPAAASTTFWLLWAGSTLAAMALLASKLHHEYYWLPLAPVAAVGAARAIERLAWHRPTLAATVLAALVAMCAFQTRSTWRIPAEWCSLEPAARAVSEIVPRQSWVAGPEALLFQADRRGCRMEWTSDAARRASGEWLGAPRLESPLDLIEYYQLQGARYFADLGCRDPLSPRKGLHDAVRERYKVIVDSPDVLIADLSNSGTHWNAN
jgi:Dolichyl-phosphate-mannose-protein mannosyltransferase